MVEGIMLKAAQHWGSDSSVVNDPLGGTSPHPIVRRPSFCVGLCEWWPYVFPTFRGRAPFWGIWQL